MKIPAQRVQELLDAWPVARLGTCGVHGQPRLVPIVFVHLEGELWSPIDGKPKRGGELARERDLGADPRAGVLLDAYGADWERLWWIALDVAARVVAVRSAPAQGLAERCAQAE